jgi:hypothetical protein
MPQCHMPDAISWGFIIGDHSLRIRPDLSLKLGSSQCRNAAATSTKPSAGPMKPSPSGTDRGAAPLRRDYPGRPQPAAGRRRGLIHSRGPALPVIVRATALELLGLSRRGRRGGAGAGLTDGEALIRRTAVNHVPVADPNATSG